MSRPRAFYADYVNYCLRFYFRYDSSRGFRNEVDNLNYNAVEKIVSNLEKRDRDILQTIFTQDNINIFENIAYASVTHKEHSKKIWSLVKFVTAEIAKERRLL